MLALGFAGLILLGALLLKLPFATRVPIDWLAALFTASSAVTVTGLAVTDTGSTFTLFGQLVILSLIQAGGIGIMTFAALTLIMLGGRLGLGQQILVREAMNDTRLRDFGALVRQVALFVLVIESIGMLALALCWVPELGWSDGLYQAFFYTISAFNNAGFALHPDSLSRWVAHPGVNLAVVLLVITGGLGFMVLSELRTGPRWHQLSLHTRMMLVGTGALLAVSFLFVAMLEWHNPHTLGALAPADRLWAALFQAVMPRTAGFNTVDVAGFTSPTLVLMVLLMFIGAGTNSTGGGIKVTTFVVLLLATRAFLRGRGVPVAFGRAVSTDAVFRALAVTVLAMMLVIAALFLLSASEPGQPLDALLFEVVSAFGTVGLSRGITAELSAPGQVLLILVMFAGRVGPLSLVFLLARRYRAPIRHPEGDVYIG